MFKYFYHENRDWPKKPTPWKTIDPKSYQTQVTDFNSAIDYLANEKWWVYDCDRGGTIEYYVAISDGKQVKYYLVEHDFSAYHGEEGFEVSNYFSTKEITKEEAHIPDDRDWLDINEFNYKLKNWPKND